MDSTGVTSAKSSEELKYGLTAGEVLRAVQNLEISSSGNLDQTAFATFNIGVAQVAFRPFNSLEDYVREMNYIVLQGINQYAHMVCFPAFSGMLPATLFPQSERVAKSYSTDPLTGKPADMWIYQTFVGMASQCFEVYFATMSALAAAHKIYIMAGTAVYPENGRFTHRALVFKPNGKLLGTQDKLSSGIVENVLQIEDGGDIKIFDTPMGKFAIIIDNDINYFEIAKIAYESGAKVIINPSVHTAPFENVNAAEGLNLRILENPVFGAKPTLIGKVPGGLELEGPGGFYAPPKFCLHNAKNGMYISTIKRDTTQVVTARLSLDNLLDSYQPYRNREFIERYVDYIY